jgi:hypothetical protein
VFPTASMPNLKAFDKFSPELWDVPENLTPDNLRPLEEGQDFGVFRLRNGTFPPNLAEKFRK